MLAFEQIVNELRSYDKEREEKLDEYGDVNSAQNYNRAESREFKEI